MLSVKRTLLIVSMSFLLNDCVNNCSYRTTKDGFNITYVDDQIIIREIENGYVIRRDTLFKSSEGYSLLNGKDSLLVLTTKNVSKKLGKYQDQILYIMFQKQNNYQSTIHDRREYRVIKYDENFKILEIQKPKRVHVNIVENESK